MLSFMFFLSFTDCLCGCVFFSDILSIYSVALLPVCLLNLLTYLLTVPNVSAHFRFLLSEAIRNEMRILFSVYCTEPQHAHHSPRSVRLSSTNLLSVLLVRASFGWLGSRVVSVLDSGTEGPGFKSQPRRCRVTVLGKLFTLIVPLFAKQRNW